MAETETAAAPQSIQARIAALNLNQVGKNPASKPPPPPAKPPSKPARSVSAYAPSDSTTSNGIGNEPDGPGPALPTRPAPAESTGARPLLPPRTPSSAQTLEVSPALPPRRPSAQSLSPALPTRRPSDQLSRKGSRESVSSVLSTVSSVSNAPPRTPASRTASIDASRIKAPAYDPASLPPLPAKRAPQPQQPGTSNEPAARPTLRGAKTTANVVTREVEAPAKRPSLPPGRPSARAGRPDAVSGEATPSLPPRRPTNQSLDEPSPELPQRPAAREPAPPPPPTARRKLPPSTIPPVAPRAVSPAPAEPAAHEPAPGPPPVPRGTRPDLAALMATKPRGAAAAAAECLHCYDFAAVDAHAARFPRASVPSLDWLAGQLTAPFAAETERARAIFTWLHHNIDYDADAFFSGNLKPSTPDGTLRAGKAVCEGYAGLFAALAVKAGLEAVVVNGHGKGTDAISLFPFLSRQGHALISTFSRRVNARD